MDEEFPLRLYLLAQGEIAPGSIPEWLLVWHYSRAPDQQLIHSHHASPQRRALAVRRHHPRFRHDLEVCLEGICQAVHPQHRLVWCLQLLQHDARTEILRLLAQPRLNSEVVEALCWALGQYGREIVLPIGDLFASALSSVRERYCQALWYLGREARGCERWLYSHDTPWARAVLYRLDEFGVSLLLQWRAAPLYLYSASLEALAARAFGLDEGERWYALQALLGWGPALPQAAELLEVLALDSDRDYARAALLGLRRLHYRPELTTVRTLLRRGPSELAALAVEMYFEPLDSIDSETVAAAAQAVSAAPSRPLEYLLSELEPEVLIQALFLLRRTGPSSGQIRDFLRGLLTHLPREFNLANLGRALLAAGGSPRELLSLVNDEGVAELLVQSAPPEFLLELVAFRSIRRQMRKCHKLLQALISWSPPQFDLLVERLAGLEPALLQELEMDSIRWSGYAQFSDVQRQVAISMIEFHRKFPEALAEELRTGRLGEVWLVRLLAKYAPPEQRTGWLVEIWTRQRGEAAPAALSALQALGAEGGEAFSQLLNGSDLRLARLAFQHLQGWMPTVELLEKPCRAELQVELARLRRSYPAGPTPTE
ncbi:MAG: hypothetical protein U0931_05705 [Vulcanimicrobiota bacterium]